MTSDQYNPQQGPQSPPQQYPPPPPGWQQPQQNPSYPPPPQQQPYGPPPTPPKKNNIMTVVIIAVIAVALILVVVMAALLGGGGQGTPEKAFSTMVKKINQRDLEGAIDVTMLHFEDQSYIDSALSNWEINFPEAYTYKVTDSTLTEKEDLSSDVRESLQDIEVYYEDRYDINIETFSRLAVNIEIGSENDSFTSFMTLNMFQVDGLWYVDFNAV